MGGKEHGEQQTTGEGQNLAQGREALKEAIHHCVGQDNCLAMDNAKDRRT